MSIHTEGGCAHLVSSGVASVCVARALAWRVSPHTTVKLKLKCCPVLFTVRAFSLERFNYIGVHCARRTSSLTHYSNTGLVSDF